MKTFIIESMHNILEFLRLIFEMSIAYSLVVTLVYSAIEIMSRFH
jgi:hypothetical protein